VAVDSGVDSDNLDITTETKSHLAEAMRAGCCQDKMHWHILERATNVYPGIWPI
jgi:hypothetical protein